MAVSQQNSFFDKVYKICPIVKSTLDFYEKKLDFVYRILFVSEEIFYDYQICRFDRILQFCNYKKIVTPTK